MTTQNQGPPGRWLPRCTLRVDPTVITLIDHIDKLVSPILDASTLGVKRYRGIDDPTSPVSLREKIDMDHVVLSFRLSRASRCCGSMKRTITTLLAAVVLVTWSTDREESRVLLIILCR